MLTQYPFKICGRDLQDTAICLGDGSFMVAATARDGKAAKIFPSAQNIQQDFLARGGMPDQFHFPKGNQVKIFSGVTLEINPLSGRGITVFEKTVDFSNGFGR
jgi:hypothetical protein